MQLLLDLLKIFPHTKIFNSNFDFPFITLYPEKYSIFLKPCELKMTSETPEIHLTSAIIACEILICALFIQNKTKRYVYC